MRLAIAPLALLSLTWLAGCRLDLAGLGRDAAADAGHTAVDPGAGSDASSSTGGDAGAGDPSATGNCVASIPQGSSLVAFEPSRAPCPAGLASNNLEVAPQAAAGACTCSCDITTQPSCTRGTLQGSYGTGAGACGAKVPPLSIAGTGCTQLQPGGPAPASIAIQPLPATAGACSATAVGDTTKVTSTPVRTCDVVGASAESVCEGAPPAGFSACLVAPGDMACPTGSPFASRTLLAASQTLVCTACSACTVSGTCDSPLVTYYSDYLCNNPVGTFPADGACQQPNWTGTLAGVEYHAMVQASCTGSGSSATFQPVSPQTLCCR